MLCFILDQFLGDLGETLGAGLYFILQLISFTGIFIIVFGLFEGFVLHQWKYQPFLLAIIIIGLVGIDPAIDLIANGFPNLTSLFG